MEANDFKEFETKVKNTFNGVGSKLTALGEKVNTLQQVVQELQQELLRSNLNKHDLNKEAQVLEELKQDVRELQNKMTHHVHNIDSDQDGLTSGPVPLLPEQKHEGRPARVNVQLGHRLDEQEHQEVHEPRAPQLPNKSSLNEPAEMISLKSSDAGSEPIVSESSQNEEHKSSYHQPPARRYSAVKQMEKQQTEKQTVKQQTEKQQPPPQKTHKQTEKQQTQEQKQQPKQQPNRETTAERKQTEHNDTSASVFGDASNGFSKAINSEQVFACNRPVQKLIAENPSKWESLLTEIARKYPIVYAMLLEMKSNSTWSKYGGDTSYDKFNILLMEKRTILASSGNNDECIRAQEKIKKLIKN